MIRRIDVPWQFDPVLSGVGKKDYPFLGHIDPHGVTVFSGFQIPAIIEEISSLSDDLVSELGGKEFLERFIQDCIECAKSRQLMWIVGD